MARAHKPRSARDPERAPKADWEREQFSVRLTAARRQRLQQIATQMPDGSTPGDAVDRAIERALAAPDQAGIEPLSLSRLNDLEELTERFAQERRSEAHKLLAQGAQALQETRSIAALISAMAASDLDSEEDEADWDEQELSAPPKVLSLRAWIEAQVRVNGQVRAIGRWSSKLRLASGLIRMELEVAPAEGGGARAMVRVEPISGESPLARADSQDALALDCRQDRGGEWLVEVRPLRADRSVGPPIGEARL